MSNRRFKILPGAVLMFTATSVFPHGAGVTGSHVMDWHSETVSRVVSPSYSWNNLGVTMIVAAGETVAIDNRPCMRAAVLDVDVRDSYGFDINEPVDLSLVLHRESSATGVVVAYDRVGGPGRAERTLDPGSNGFVELTIPLPSARFANRGDHGTDLMLTATIPSGPAQQPELITVCDIRVARSFATPTEPHGWLDLTIVDEHRTATAARVGLYDAMGRLPIPAPEAVDIRKFDDMTETYLLQTTAVWPHQNRFVFYVDGRYRARIPVGPYQIVAMKGIEYRLINETLEVRADRTTRKTLRLKRHVDMPGRGWYSGDVHIHNLRNQDTDSEQLLAQTRGEDVHIANILEMGNVARTYFPQYAWGITDRKQRGVHTIVPGQEDPRTLTLGHTIHLNLEHPIRFPDDYLNYHRVFEAVAAEGGISGFAHASGGLPGTTEGMTIQAASGLLDFGEVMQSSEIGTDVWFSLLNLGYRFAPAAGTDYPYIDHPGAVRGYVETGTDYNVDAWFAGLANGRTFVTNGPILEMTLNGQGMGSEVRVDKGQRLNVSASAVLNPDIGGLVGLELIKHGEVVASESSADGAESLTLDFSEAAQESAWYVVRAHGQRPGHSASITAITAPVYVVVDGKELAWKREAVANIANRLISALENVKNRASADVIDSEAWHTMAVWAEEFPPQLESARARIEAAQEHLRDLILAAQRATPEH
ncbi:MAG: CehA/McbA family metallohydrolase [Gammaproteobacteria bacterium]|nr:CehA/McbA family metallohydrolase [Gammaproteobacteria bacterium]